MTKSVAGAWWRNRRGVALPLTMIALLVVGGLVAGSFLLALLERRSGESALHSAQALAAAEAGLDETVATWRSSHHGGLAVGSTRGLPMRRLAGGVSYVDSLSRLSPTLYLLRSIGQRRAGNGTILARVQLARFVRLDGAVPDIRAAVTTLQGTTLSGSSEIHGEDSLPPSWGSLCPSSAAPAAGVRDSGGSIAISGACVGGSCVSGSPPIFPDSSLRGTVLTQFGPVSFSTLFAAADLTVGGLVNGVAPRVAGTTCDVSDSLNWGEPVVTTPLHPCFGYLPVIAAQGGTVLGSGRGQGVLLVNGDLEISGGFEFYGPAVVLGTLRGLGAGGRIFGAVLAQRADLSDETEVRFSACAVARATAGSAKPRPTNERSWSRLF